MNYVENNSRALQAAEAQLITAGKRIEELRLLLIKEREQSRQNFYDMDANQLRATILNINLYDEQVQMIISANPLLGEAWDSFRVQYQLMANKELLETAREKMVGVKEGKCHGCGRPFK